MSPQEKKALSYERNGRNCYGENSKSSRKAIPLRKAKQHRKHRHEVQKALITATDTEVADFAVKGVKRGLWRKVPDIPLAEHVEHKVTRRVRSGQQPAE